MLHAVDNMSMCLPLFYFLTPAHRDTDRQTDRDRVRERKREREFIPPSSQNPRTPSPGVAWLMTVMEGTNRSPCSCVTVPVSMLQWGLTVKGYIKGNTPVMLTVDRSLERVTPRSC